MVYFTVNAKQTVRYDRIMEDLGWVVTIDEHRCNAARMWRSSSADVELDTGGLTVEVEQGRGYLREHSDVFIPIEVLVQLLEGRGFKVTPPSTPVVDFEPENFCAAV